MALCPSGSAYRHRPAVIGEVATIVVSNSTVSPYRGAADGHGIGLTVVTAAVAADGGTLELVTTLIRRRVVMRVQLPTAEASRRRRRGPVASSAFVTDRA